LEKPLPDPFDDADALQELEGRICVLAGHIHAATYRLLSLIREFDRRGGWKLAGHRNCADWLHFRTGIARGAAREKVRTARALERLPLTAEAMARGELSFSKVRAVSRLVDDLHAPGNEDAEAELLGYARECTAAELEKLVRSWNLVGRLDDEERERRRHRSRYLSVAPDGDGMYVIRGRLDPEVGALLMRAVEAASDALFRAGEDWAPEGGGRGPLTEEVTPRQRRADALGLLAERALAAGFGNAAAEDRPAEDPPAEDRPAEDQPAPGAGEPAPLSGTRPERYQVLLHVDAGTLQEDGEVAHSHLEDGTRVSAETCRRLTCDASVVQLTTGADGSVLDVGRRTRTIPPALRRALEIRDAGCRFPGCGLRFTEAHHRVHWADGGLTNLANLLLLCRHHHRAVHEEGFRIRRHRDGRLQFFDRTGWPLPESAPLSTLGPEAVEDLVRRNHRRGVEPDDFTPSATWKREADIPWERRARAWEALDPP
jgi:hypothetical protein